MPTSTQKYLWVILQILKPTELDERIFSGLAKAFPSYWENIQYLTENGHSVYRPAGNILPVPLSTKRQGVLKEYVDERMRVLANVARVNVSYRFVMMTPEEAAEKLQLVEEEM